MERTTSYSLSTSSSSSSVFDAASSNRAASRKFFAQLIQSSRSAPLSVPPPLDGPPMLHRSPSGAKRKIRQRNEAGGSRPSPFLNPTSSNNNYTGSQPQAPVSSSPSSYSSSPSPAPSSVTSSASITMNTSSSECRDYRSMIDSGAYQSILPDLDSSFASSTSSHHSRDRYGGSPQASTGYGSPSSDRAERTAPPATPTPSSSIPTPMPRMNLPISSFSSSLSQLERVSSPASSTPTRSLDSSFTSSSPSPVIPSRLVADILSPPSSGYPDGRERATSDISRPSESGPPVQAVKPTVEVHPMPSEQRKKEKPAVPAKPRNLKIDNSLAPPTSPSMNKWSSASCLHSMSPSPVSSASTMFINQLFSTPSFANLTAAYKNTEDMDPQEREDLENRRIESMCSLSTRVARLGEELSLLHKEMAANEELGHAILAVVYDAQPVLYEKVRRQLEHERELGGLETKLRIQLEKCTLHLNEGLTEKRAEAAAEETRLRGKLKETRLLRQIFANRERDVESSLATILNDDERRHWGAYKETLYKMIEESRIIESALNDSKLQLRTLHATASHLPKSPLADLK